MEDEASAIDIQLSVTKHTNLNVWIGRFFSRLKRNEELAVSGLDHDRQVLDIRLLTSMTICSVTMLRENQAN